MIFSRAPSPRFEKMWAQIRHSTDHWGDGSLFRSLSPHARDNVVYRRLAPNVERSCASPGMARVMLNALWDYDVTGAVDTVDVPTLVLHRAADIVPVEGARWAADENRRGQDARIPRRRAHVLVRRRRHDRRHRGLHRWQCAARANLTQARHRPLHRHRRVDGSGRGDGGRALVDAAHYASPCSARRGRPSRRHADQDDGRRRACDL